MDDCGSGLNSRSSADSSFASFSFTLDMLIIFMTVGKFFLLSSAQYSRR